MNFVKKIKHKIQNSTVSLIEWNRDTDFIAWQFPFNSKKICHKALLKVGASQIAVLYADGHFTDLYQPGSYELSTATMPVLTTLKSWSLKYKSPFKAEVYFLNTQRFENFVWKTSNLVHTSSSQSIYAEGVCSFLIDKEPQRLLTNLTRYLNEQVVHEIESLLNRFIVNKFTAYLTDSSISSQDLKDNLPVFSQELMIILKEDFANYGIVLEDFQINSIQKITDNSISNNLKFKHYEKNL